MLRTAFSATLLAICGIVSLAIATDSAAIFVPLGLVPVYESPVSGALPQSYLEPADTCRSDGSAVDSAGTAWLSVKSGARIGWVRRESVRRPDSSGGRAEVQAALRKKDPDAKRRYRILEQHTDWPRRIVKAVRDGVVCLDMNEEQLAAAWGEPVQKSAAFILGAGAHGMWYYKSSNGSITVIFLVKGRVVGWSEQ